MLTICILHTSCPSTILEFKSVNIFLYIIYGKNWLEHSKKYPYEKENPTKQSDNKKITIIRNTKTKTRIEKSNESRVCIRIYDSFLVNSMQYASEFANHPTKIPLWRKKSVIQIVRRQNVIIIRPWHIA